MAAKTIRGEMIIRRWGRGRGLTETSVQFASLDELFSHALDITKPDVIDRLHIVGFDESGRERTLTLTFQSLTSEMQT